MTQTEEKLQAALGLLRSAYISDPRGPLVTIAETALFLEGLSQSQIHAVKQSVQHFAQLGALMRIRLSTENRLPNSVRQAVDDAKYLGMHEFIIEQEIVTSTQSVDAQNVDGLLHLVPQASLPFKLEPMH